MLVGLTFFSLMSCTNDDDSVQDPRDQYVGSWNAAATGSLTLSQNYQSIGTAPLNESRAVML